jgi:hypothetical protein
MSVALGGTIFAALGGATAGTLLSSPQAGLAQAKVMALQNTFVTSFHAALLVCAAFAALGIFTVLARGSEAGVKKARLSGKTALNVCGYCQKEAKDDTML